MDLSFLLSPRLFPEWRVYSEFINDHLSRALKLDAKLSSHAIEVECPDANQINQVKIGTHISMNRLSAISQIFDALSYSKAASGK